MSRAEHGCGGPAQPTCLNIDWKINNFREVHRQSDASELLLLCTLSNALSLVVHQISVRFQSSTRPPLEVADFLTSSDEPTPRPHVRSCVCKALKRCHITRVDHNLNAAMQ